MKIVFGKTLKDSDGMSFFNVYNNENDKTYLGAVEKPSGHQNWSINQELNAVFPDMPRHTKQKNILGIKSRLKLLAKKITDRQAEVRYIGYEQFLDVRPERGLGRFTTTELWAEILHRVREEFPGQAIPNHIDEVEKVFAETSPFPKEN